MKSKKNYQKKGKFKAPLSYETEVYLHDFIFDGINSTFFPTKEQQSNFNNYYEHTLMMKDPPTIKVLEVLIEEGEFVPVKLPKRDETFFHTLHLEFLKNYLPLYEEDINPDEPKYSTNFSLLPRS
ncbi:hypothetical protein CO037_00790 [Candidatus Pacearchaeota archaeon CG_4_9_14_0_2_um_filter_30_8]|nr:MAG: hypothetical protein CO037_00790 [Candidatus Pacearchaeota archaeon CG_4_9_14_0_2_um_filter_30_8]